MLNVTLLSSFPKKVTIFTAVFNGKNCLREKVRKTRQLFSISIPTFRGFVEAGLGEKGLFCAGLRYKF
jgi:hypothetical protein